MASAAVKLMTADEFLLWQQNKDARYELVDGIPIEMMTGASEVHDRVVINLIMPLGRQLRGTRCRPTTADVALKTKGRGVRRPKVMAKRTSGSLGSVSCSNISDWPSITFYSSTLAAWRRRFLRAVPEEPGRPATSIGLST